MPKYLRCHLIRVIAHVLAFGQLDSILQNIAEKSIKLALGAML